MNSETRPCQNCKQNFVIETEDFAFYEKIKVPPPTWCPECRLIRRLAFWPFGKFHKRQCDLTGENIISIYPPKTRFPVYKNANWYSDKWEPPIMEYDPGRPFMDQMYELQTKTPRPHLYGTNNVNCDYSDDVWESKNCYLCRSLMLCEDLSYSYRVVRCRDSFDLFYCYDAEQSYDCIYCFNVYKVRHARNTRDSYESAFLYDCRNVRNCFMCWNLRNKEYHILNKPYTKEGYFEKLKEYYTGSQSQFLAIAQEFEDKIKNEAIHKVTMNVKTVNSSGNYMTDCKNCKNCYFLETSEDCSYVHRGAKNKDSQDLTGMWGGNLCYEICQLMDGGYRLVYSNYCTNCRNSEYLDFCVDCEYCFGCVGLRKKKFCVLNKQYSEEEYGRIVGKIKDAMKKNGTYGLFFPQKMATCGYNLSLAGILFPKIKEAVSEAGGEWEELEKKDPEGAEIAPFTDDIKGVGDGIIYKGLRCEESGRVFNITKVELAYLRAHDIPLPRFYPDIRVMRRMQKLFYITPRPIQCFLCGKEIPSYYPPEWGYKKIACEACYQKEVV
ncbi:MAG: hypothetical protein A3C07_01130 [Candidatus Sungbacteria bacterium RIFCSPHIGHO2_02_FULL_47_11]|uniref:Uncharacterized protein n=1 Tax=Candidatus Sungbacteria bacterium RIFCSPHIGHO2_02_FULL_47_11 TaxID=1802270 RepID=A0A1G2KGL0_9BACT|nr:MAG: hypothetical protein A3C07_01130 [Candidatus Sungbacteria bacterium RIFCSPHIGHO2_02_FULL_47_11]